MRALMLAALALGATGCAPDLQALAQDHNSDCLTVTTPWGTQTLERNGGCHYPPMGFVLVPAMPTQGVRP